MAFIGGEDEDCVDVGVVNHLLRGGGLVRDIELCRTMLCRGRRQIADGFNLEQMREKQETRPVADLENLLNDMLATCSSPRERVRTPAPIMPKPSLRGEDMLSDKLNGRMNNSFFNRNRSAKLCSKAQELCDFIVVGCWKWV